MQIFEFQFNPKSKNERIETLSHEPDNDAGNLYLIAEMRNIIPGNEKLLGRIIKMMRDEYVSEALSDPFKKSLLRVNEYLSAEIAQNNVSWLGNLHLGALSISRKRVEVAKIGKVSFFLTGNGKIENLDERIKEEKPNNNFHPKAFGKLISGRIALGERIAILTEKPLNIFLKSDVLKQISESHFLDKKSIERLVNKQKKELSAVSGAFLLIDTNNHQKEKKVPLSKEVDFSLKEVITPLKEIIKNIFPEKKEKKTKKLPIKSLVRLPKSKIRKEYKKAFFLFMLMAILLTLGFFIFQGS